MSDSLRHRWLDACARMACSHPGRVLAVAGFIAAASVALTVAMLGFQPDRNALISESLDWNQKFIEWREAFPGADDMFVVIDAGPEAEPDHAERVEQAQAFVREVAGQLEKSEHVQRVVWSYPTAAFSARTLRMEEMPAFKARLGDIRDAAFVMESPTPGDLIARAVRAMSEANAETGGGGGVGDGAGAGADADDGPGSVQHTLSLLDAFERLIDAMRRVLAQPPGDRPSFGDIVDPPVAPHRYVTANGRMLFIRVTPVRYTDKIDMYKDAIETIRGVIGSTLPKYPKIEAGLTGIDVIESDETTVAERDATKSSIVAFLLIAVLLVVAYRSIRTPALLLGALLFGIAWSFGFTTLAVGHLQVISIIFTAILLGLGVDFGIHLAACYERVRHEQSDDAAGCGLAMRKSFRIVGPGMVTGAVTTAIAFATTLLTDFKGVAEMGVIAAAGVLLCLIGMLTVFPALVRLAKPLHRHVAPPAERRLDVFKEQWIEPVSRSPRSVLVVALLVSAASLGLATQMRFDYDLLKVFPKNIDSLDWQRRTAAHGGTEIWTASIVAKDLQAARDIKRRLLAEAGDVVALVDGIGMLMPADDAEKIAMIEAMKKDMAASVNAVVTGSSKPGAAAPDPIQQLRFITLGLRMQAASTETPPAIRAKLTALNDTIGQLLASHDALRPDQRQLRRALLRAEYHQFRVRTAKLIHNIFDTSPLTPADVPEALLASYVSPDTEAVALEVYPRVPSEAVDGTTSTSGALDPMFLPRFVQTVEKVEPGVTGVMVQIYRSGDLIKISYQQAGLYALIAVFVLVWLDFRRVSDALLCMVPVASGFAMTFGIMQLVGEPINAANIIVLPLMFGIGVDAGVHLMHRYRQDPVTRPLGLTQGTGKGITLTSLSTMIGFGSMLFAEHRGVAAVAFVLTLGIGLTLLSCWLIMPACLELRKGSRGGEPAPEH